MFNMTKKYDYSKLPSRQTQQWAKDILNEIGNRNKISHNTQDGLEVFISADFADQYNDHGYFWGTSESNMVYVDLLNYPHSSQDTIDQSLIDWYKGKISFDQLNPELFTDEKVRQSLISFAESLMHEATKVEMGSNPILKFFMNTKLNKITTYINNVCESKLNQLQDSKPAQSQTGTSDEDTKTKSEDNAPSPKSDDDIPPAM